MAMLAVPCDGVASNEWMPRRCATPERVRKLASLRRLEKVQEDAPQDRNILCSMVPTNPAYSVNCRDALTNTGKTALHELSSGNSQVDVMMRKIIVMILAYSGSILAIDAFAEKCFAETSAISVFSDRDDLTLAMKTITDENDLVNEKSYADALGVKFSGGELIHNVAGLSVCALPPPQTDKDEY
ncbi:hypothetical protein [Burkholderia sp. Bp8963]|uniref:hypothetical protein n=1 Tax=Burkholderia sp. Bp8963 TaxID=2184547 RepID=UPI000F5B3CDE|nr:hypothetical protein [Burkholderia sp. Bp8963]